MKPESADIEKYLLSQLREGSKEAFERLYKLHSERLYLNILRLVKSKEEAEEILQEIFVLLWEKRSTIDIHSSFRSYLLRIGENKAYDYFRKLRRDQRLYHSLKILAVNQCASLDLFSLEGQKEELLKQAIVALPPQRRRVYELCKLEGKSYQEASAILNISTSTINDHIVKGTQAIRVYLLSRSNMATLLVLSVILDGVGLD